MDPKQHVAELKLNSLPTMKEFPTMKKLSTLCLLCSNIATCFAVFKHRGDYDYCRVPRTQKIKKNSNMVKQKVVTGVSRHAESKSGLGLVLTLLLHGFLSTF